MISIINKTGLVNDTLVFNSKDEDITEDLSITKLDVKFELGCVVKATLTCNCSSVDFRVRVNFMHYEFNKQVFRENRFKRIN